MVRGPTRAGLAFADPAALSASWDLKLGPPLLSPGRAYHGYLGAIFTGVLKNGLPFTDSWAAQILSAAAWLQVAMLSGYGRAEAMRAMHKGVYRAYATAPHDVQATVKAVYSVLYTLPAPRHTVAQHISKWHGVHAYWEGGAVQQLVCTRAGGCARGNRVLVLRHCLHAPIECGDMTLCGI